MPDTKANSRQCACWMIGSDEPGVATQMQKVINSCKGCIQHEGIHAKAPMCNQSLLPHLWSCCMLNLLALRQQWSWINPQIMVNLLVFATILWSTCYGICKPQLKLWKPVAKIQWQGYILIFGAPAKLLSNWRANFESNIIRDLLQAYGHMEG